MCGQSDLDSDIVDKLKKARRTKRGVHCKDLIKLAHEILKKLKKGEESLCVYVLALYLERIPYLVDCAARRSLRLEIDERVSMPIEAPSPERLSLSLIRCLDEEISTLNLLRRASPCDFYQVTAFLRLTSSWRNKERIVGRVEAIVRECAPLCTSDEQRAILEAVRKKLAEEGDKVIEALEKHSLYLIELFCKERSVELGSVFCKNAEEVRTK
ncbi:MAG: hypothetical protein QXK14_03390 [Acidilobaceae archaeon]